MSHNSELKNTFSFDFRYYNYRNIINKCRFEICSPAFNSESKETGVMKNPQDPRS